MSFTPAQAITSSQVDIHKNLNNVVQKHLDKPNQKPIAEYNRQAFEQAYTYWQNQGQPKVLLDSGCGTGESSRYLAQHNPSFLVIGLDRSAKRLTHNDNQTLADNCLLLRCDCTDFWRLAHQQQWSFARHTLLYPNPYPKPAHLQRRWHGDAAFPSLLAISQEIELRTNWDIYAQEFYQALLIGNRYKQEDKKISIQSYQSVKAITAFERKYLQSGHSLWQVCMQE